MKRFLNYPIFGLLSRDTLEPCLVLRALECVSDPLGKPWCIFLFSQENCVMQSLPSTTSLCIPPEWLGQGQTYVSINRTPPDSTQFKQGFIFNPFGSLKVFMAPSLLGYFLRRVLRILLLKFFHKSLELIFNISTWSILLVLQNEIHCAVRDADVESQISNRNVRTFIKHPNCLKHSLQIIIWQSHENHLQVNIKYSKMPHYYCRPHSNNLYVNVNNKVCKFKKNIIGY